MNKYIKKNDIKIRNISQSSNKMNNAPNTDATKKNVCVSVFVQCISASLLLLANSRCTYRWDIREFLVCNVHIVCIRAFSFGSSTYNWQQPELAKALLADSTTLQKQRMKLWNKSLNLYLAQYPYTFMLNARSLNWSLYWTYARWKWLIFENHYGGHRRRCASWSS